MKNRTLSLSLLVSAVLAVPTLAMAATDVNTDVNTINTAPTDTIVQEEAEAPNAELLETQPSSIDNDETEGFSEEGEEVTEADAIDPAGQALDQQYEKQNSQTPVDMNN